jgi:hypothetical protein
LNETQKPWFSALFFSFTVFLLSARTGRLVPSLVIRVIRVLLFASSHSFDKKGATAACKVENEKRRKSAKDTLLLSA